MTTQDIDTDPDPRRPVRARSTSLTGWRGHVRSLAPETPVPGGKSSPTRLRHVLSRLVVAAAVVLAMGLVGLPAAEAQVTQPFTVPAVATYAGDPYLQLDHDFDVTFDFSDLAPLTFKRAGSVVSVSGATGAGQATANLNGPRGFQALAVATMPSPTGPYLPARAYAAMDFTAYDPLGRDRVKLTVEFRGIADAGAPHPNTIGSFSTTQSAFRVEVGEYWDAGRVRQDPGGAVVSQWIQLVQPPLLAVSGAHSRSTRSGGWDTNVVAVSANGQQVEWREGSGVLVYNKAVVLNAPAGAYVVTIDAFAEVNAFTYVDPVVRPHPDNPEVVVTMRGAIDPDPPPLAVPSPEELTAAGIDITPIGALGLFDPPAPPNRPPVAQCQNVTVPAPARFCTDASIDNGSHDPDGDTLTLTQSPAGPYAPGVTQVTLTASDGALSSQCTATVTVTTGLGGRPSQPGGLTLAPRLGGGRAPTRCRPDDFGGRGRGPDGARP